MISGGCLCGGVRYEIAAVVGPFELCHCTRCRKATGSAFVAGLGVATAGFRLLAGAEIVRRYEAPVVEHPPGYRTAFCGRCGSPVPDPPAGAAWFEIPAGTLDGDPEISPDRHIFVEHRPAWSPARGGIPELTKRDVIAFRMASLRDRR
jgi:hypothetical protein